MSRPIQKMPRKPPVAFTLERKLEFLEHYRRTGLKYQSAELCGVSNRTVDDHIKRDPEFAELAEQAKQRWVDERLLNTAHMRAIVGSREPVVGGKFKDQIVAYKRVHSDNLMLALLKANRSEFRNDGTAEGAGGGVMIVPASPQTIDDWQQNYGEMAKGQPPAGFLDDATS